MIAMSDNVQIRKDSPSGTIVINRPNRKNALARETIEAIQTALEDFQQERTVRAVIITGSNDVFSAGTDLHQVKETAEMSDAHEQWQSDVDAFQELIEYILRFPKPIIASVNGPVIGSGLALVLASDVVVATESASVALPEAQLGLSAGITGPLLAFRVGAGRASYLMTTGRKLDAAETQSFGIFHEVVPDSVGWARCQELSEQIAKGARHSYCLTKQMLNETFGETLFTHLSIGSAHTATARCSEDGTEGVRAFVEKREPEWPN